MVSVHLGGHSPCQGPGSSLVGLILTRRQADNQHRGVSFQLAFFSRPTFSAIRKARACSYAAADCLRHKNVAADAVVAQEATQLCHPDEQWAPLRWLNSGHDSLRKCYTLRQQSDAGRTPCSLLLLPLSEPGPSAKALVLGDDYSILMSSRTARSPTQKASEAMAI